MAEKTKRRYTVVLVPEEEGRYKVLVPALPGCVTCGDTVEEALIMAKDAIELYIDSELEHGEGVPAEGSEALITTISVEVPRPTLAPPGPAEKITLADLVEQLGELSIPEAFADDLESLQSAQPKLSSLPWPS